MYIYNLKTPNRGGNNDGSKYLFRFLPEEIKEMEDVLKEHNHFNPPARVFNSLASKFSKKRHQSGDSHVRPDSVQNWFRKKRHMIRQAAKAARVAKAAKDALVNPTEPLNPTPAAEMEESPIDGQKSDDEDSSSKRSSEEESSEEEMQAAKALSSVKSTEPSDPTPAAEMEDSPIDGQNSDVEEGSSKSSSEEEGQAAKALSSMKSTEPSDPTPAAEMEDSPIDVQKSDGEDSSSKISLEEESSEGGTSGEEAPGRIVRTSSVSNLAEIVNNMDVPPQPVPLLPTSSVSNSAAIVNHMDVPPQPVPLLRCNVSDVDSVLVRLAKFKRALPEASPITSLNQQTDAAHASSLDARDILLQAKLTLERVAGMNLVDFKNHQKDFDAAVSIMVEKGSLSDKEKTDLLLLQERILMIVKENEHAREELRNCHSFGEKIIEVAESSNKIMKKANRLEEKYNNFPQEMRAVSSKISQLEEALVQAKAELEMMKGDQEDAAIRLAELSQSLESVNKQYKSLKAEEPSMINKRARIEERLVKSTEEWVQLTHSTGFTGYRGQ